MAVHIILLRAIGPATHRLMRMADWREASLMAGFDSAETYAATGNMIAQSDMPAEKVKRATKDILEGFGLGASNGVFIRSPADLDRLIAENPFADAASERPKDLTACFLSGPGDFGWMEGHAGPERFEELHGELIVDYPDGVPASKVPPGTIERRAGVTMTFRNWNTVCALAERGR